jgi:hypothetical protein
MDIIKRWTSVESSMSLREVIIAIWPEILSGYQLSL